MKPVLFSLLLICATPLFANTDTITKPVCSATQIAQAEPVYKQAMHVSQSNMPEAIALLKQALTLCSSPKVVLALAQAYLNQQQWQAADETLDGNGMSAYFLSDTQAQQSAGYRAAIYWGKHQQAIQHSSDYPKTSLCQQNRFGKQGCGFLAQAVVHLKKALASHTATPNWLKNIQQLIDSARADYSWQENDMIYLDKLLKSTGGTPPMDLPIHFGFNHAQLSAAARQETQAVIQFIEQQERPGVMRYQLQLRGHTDSIGSETYNEELSLRRATSVQQVLRQQFPQHSINIMARGEWDLTCHTNDANCRQRNRRVELRLIPQ